MEDRIEYELLNIEWELNYEFEQKSSISIVHESTDEPVKEDINNPSIVYDENGIPMGESTEAVKIRRQLIYDFYEQWKVIHPEKSIYNKSLKSDILIRQESVVEAAAHAAKRYKSTLAVYKLDEVLAEATKISEDIPKPGNKNQRKLIRMILMSYDHPLIGRIKLTVGVRNRTLDKIQYGITAILENETVVPATESKKKAPHKK